MRGRNRVHLDPQLGDFGQGGATDLALALAVGFELGREGDQLPDNDRNTFDPRNLVCHFKAALATAGLPPATQFHNLRHWCASLLIAFGTREHTAHA